MYDHTEMKEVCFATTTRLIVADDIDNFHAWSRDILVGNAYLICKIENFIICRVGNKIVLIDLTTQPIKPGFSTLLFREPFEFSTRVGEDGALEVGYLLEIGADVSTDEGQVTKLRFCGEECSLAGLRLYKAWLRVTKEEKETQDE